MTGRRAVAAAAATGFALLGALTGAAAPPAAAAGADPAPWAPAGSAAVHPGVTTVTGETGCTTNFLFTDDSGALYLGQAALCARANPEVAEGPDGQRTASGCTAESLPIGTPVEIEGTGVTGTLAYSSWLTMQAVQEKITAICTDNNFALVKLPDDARDTINPSVPGLGGPVGLRPDRLGVTQDVVAFGGSPLRPADPLRSMRGEVAGYTLDGWGYLMYTVLPGLPGDSGAGYLDAGGYALGSLSNLVLLPPGSNNATYLPWALDYARDRGGMTGLRLVPGTEPFRGILLESSVP